MLLLDRYVNKFVNIESKLIAVTGNIKKTLYMNMEPMKNYVISLVYQLEI